MSILAVHLKLPFTLLLYLIQLGPSWLMGQSAIAITIDDVPNTRSYAAAQGRALLLAQLDSLTQSRFGRQISQIYLCHDNPLNAAYLPKIVAELASLGHPFMSLDDALQDPAYAQKDRYAKKWGISWHYRWMTDQAERRAWMEREPPIDAVEAQFEQIK